MKKSKTIASQGALSLGALLLATSLCVGAEPTSGAAQETPNKSKATVVAKKQPSPGKSGQKRAEITGSRIRYRVKAGEQRPATALSVTVIDPQSAVNRGYGGPLEALLRNPAVFRGR